VTNGQVMPGGKKLRSDDPNFKSLEQIRWGPAAAAAYIGYASMCFDEAK
jgi:hypothetical protein